MIIKDLKECGNKTRNRLREQTSKCVSGAGELELLRRKLSALRELQNYVQFGGWTREHSRRNTSLFSQADLIIS